MNSIQFLKTALKDYRMVGTPAATSRYAVERIISHLTAEDVYIVEYGPGDGVITKRILEALPTDGRVMAIELAQDFRWELEQIRDQRLTVVYDDVAAVVQHLGAMGLPRIDIILSGIPFSLMQSRVREDIIRNTYAVLRPGGKFILYQSTLLAVPLLKNYFGEVRWQFEPRNLPPYFIIIAEK